MENRGLLKAFPKVTRKTLILLLIISNRVEPEKEKTEIYRIPRFGVYRAYIELNKIQPFKNSNIF